jgi:hypothetical protein
MTEGSQTVFGLRDYVFDRLNKKPADFWEKPAEKKEATPSPSVQSPAPETEKQEEETD